MQSVDRPSCRICGTTESLLRCAKCKTVHYCSAVHQRRDWAAHRQLCNELARAKREMQVSRGLAGGGGGGVVGAQQVTEPNGAATQNENEMMNSQALDSNYGKDTGGEVFLNSLRNNGACGYGRYDEHCTLDLTDRRYEDLCRIVINDMNTYGLSVIDDFLGMDKGLEILNEVHKMYDAGVFTDGQLVSNSSAGRNLRTIRGDKIAWVKGVESECANIGYLINQIDAVICRANSMNDNGLLGHYTIRERTKAMVACYPGSGSHYLMHVDNPNRDGRVITAIYYLNVNWDTRRSGGILRICPEHDGAVADIEPKFDRLIFFWSDRRNPHEVQPAHRTRYAITVWYFDAHEREMALNRTRQFENTSASSSNCSPSSSNSST